MELVHMTMEACESKPSVWTDRVETQGQVNNAVRVQRLFAADFTLALGRLVFIFCCSILAFIQFDEVHPHYRPKSTLLKAHCWSHPKNIITETSRKMFDYVMKYLQPSQADISNQWSHFPFLASLIGQLVKNPPAVQETLIWFLGWEDPLEKGTATYSSILAWRIPWTV